MPDHWLCFKQNLPKINRSTAQFTTRSTFHVHVNVVPAPPDREEHGLGAYNFETFQGLQLNVKLFFAHAAEGLVQLGKLIRSCEKKSVVVRREPEILGTKSKRQKFPCDPSARWFQIVISYIHPYLG